MSNPTIRPAPSAAKSNIPPVCPILTLGVLSPPSAIVGAPTKIATLPCLGPGCAFFHAAGACSVLVMADALLAQAHMMAANEGEETPTDAKPANPS